MLAEPAAVDRWLREVVAPIVTPQIEAFNMPLNAHEQARLTVTAMIDGAFQAADLGCHPTETAAARQLWKWVWCDVVAQLVLRGKLDEELDDILRACGDPGFDPRAPHASRRARSANPSARVRALPMTRRPMPSNYWTLSSREAMAKVGVMRLMEGTAAGVPILANVPSLVLLAFNPAWRGHSKVRAEFIELASRNLMTSFAQVSFIDTRRHFGKPQRLGDLTWVLTATSPERRVFPAPIVGTGSNGPSKEQWSKILAHAGGFVGAPRVQRIVRPRRFGDLTRWMAQTERRTAHRVHAQPRKNPPRATRGRSKRSRFGHRKG